MLAVGSTFGRYRIERAIGAGGMGRVYEVEDTLLRRRVALKVVSAGEHAAARILREARAAAALKHPNAVDVYDVGEIDGVAYIAMELVEGETLSAHAASPVALEQKVRWLVEIASALDAAHRVGLVHRDVKPDNVMVTRDGSVKVLDFGIAKRTGDGGASADAAGPASFRTAEGVVTGTPRYMAPEQLAGGKLDGRTDQFAWGVVAYLVLSGIHPQSTTGSAERWGAPPKALARVAGVPDEVSAVVMRALERGPEHRFASMSEIVRALAPFAGTARAPAPDAGVATELGSAPTVRLEDGAATAATAAITAITATEPALLPRVVAAQLVDPTRPTWRRLLFPAMGAGLMFAGLADMLLVLVAMGATSAPALGVALTRAGWMVLFVAPALALARAPREAQIALSTSGVVVRGARGMSQTLDPGAVVGAAAAPLASGFGVVVAPKRLVSIPIALRVPTEEDAHAVLASLGHARALTGTITWPLRPGLLDRVALVAAVAWRIAIPATSVPDASLSALAFGIAVLTGLVAAGLSFAPRPGPRLELSADHVRVLGQTPPLHIALRDLDEASATPEALRLRLRSGASHEVRAPSSRFARQCLGPDAREQLVGQVNAAASRARAAYT
ncbi:MAG TPA: serine/threonine-protein kinase [Labilithrix sp.]